MNFLFFNHAYEWEQIIQYRYLSHGPFTLHISKRLQPKWDKTSKRKKSMWFPLYRKITELQQDFRYREWEIWLRSKKSEVSERWRAEQDPGPPIMLISQVTPNFHSLTPGEDSCSLFGPWWPWILSNFWGFARGQFPFAETESHSCLLYITFLKGRGKKADQLIFFIANLCEETSEITKD